MLNRYDKINTKGGHIMIRLKQGNIQKIIEATKDLTNGFTINDIKEAIPELSQCVIKKYLHRGVKESVFIRVDRSIGGRGNQTKYQVNPQEPVYIDKKEVIELFNNITQLFTDFINK